MATALVSAVMAASADVWNVTLTLRDPSRTSLFHPHGRSIDVIVCGDSTTKAAPLYIWAHGFDCRAADYQWFCQTPNVVTALVVSSDLSPFLPDTADLAKDQAFLSTALPAEAANASSPLHGRLSGQVVLGGHSMGGGTSVLAADPSYVHASIDALALFAPGLYTLPPAYSHRSAVSAPLLVVSGAMDCGPNALPKEAEPLFHTVSSTVKALVVLKGANHCQWSTPTHGGVCAHSECHEIDRDAQQAAGRRLLAAFLPAALPAALSEGSSNGSGSAWDAFESFLAAGRTRGEWTFVTMRSPANVTNACPCS